MMEIRGLKSRTCISINSMTPRTYSVGTPISRLKYALTEDVLQSQCCGSEKWRWRNHWTILLTSLSIEGRDFPEFEMLDAKIASTLERIISNQYFRRRVNVEEQECSKKYDRFPRGRQLACMIFDHFRATGAHDALDLSDRVDVSSQGDDIQDFDTRWDQTPVSACEVPKENVLESLYKMKIRESVELQTALAMYEQKIDRDRTMPSYQILKTK